MEKDVDAVLREHEAYIRSVVSIVSNRLRFTDTAVHNYDDLLSHARVAAWKAISTYKKDRGVKLTTYIYRCVSNRLYDLRNRNKKTIDSVYDLPEVEDQGCEIESVEISHDISKIFTPEELHLFRRITKGDFLNEIIEEKSRSNNISKWKSRKEVLECLQHIKLKLTSIGLNPTI